MTSKKIILHFIHGLNTGGAETLVKEYVLKLNKEKFDVKVLCFSKLNSPYEKTLIEHGIDVYYTDIYLPFKRRGNIIQRVINCIIRLIIVRNYIQKVKPDIIHSHLLINFYLAFAHPARGTELFYTMHSEPYAYWGNHKNFIDFLSAKYLLKKYKMTMIALHERMRNELNTLFHVSNTCILNNGIDFERFNKTFDKKSIRLTLGIPENSFVICHIGRFSEVKNHDFIVKVFDEVAKKKKDAFLLLIGDGPLKQKIRNELESENYSGNYLILSDRTDIPELLGASDVFIFPSQYEGLGIVLIEAQKMKLPCVVSDTVPKFAQVSNLIKWLSLSDSVSEWAEWIYKLKVENVEYYHIENWDMNQIIKKVEHLYLGEGV